MNKKRSTQNDVRLSLINVSLLGSQDVMPSNSPAWFLSEQLSTKEKNQYKVWTKSIVTETIYQENDDQ